MKKNRSNRPKAGSNYFFGPKLTFFDFLADQKIFPPEARVAPTG